MGGTRGGARGGAGDGDAAALIFELLGRANAVEVRLSEEVRHVVTIAVHEDDLVLGVRR